MSDFTSLPASLTKHLDYLAHPLPRQVSTHASLIHPVELQQRSAAYSENTGTGTTGTTLWLGAQLMAAYLAESLGYIDEGQSSKQVIELGGGVGYLAIVLAAMGYDVTTTDIEPPLSQVLRPNIERNSARFARGSITARDLDWCAFPSDVTSTETGPLDDQATSHDTLAEWTQPWDSIVTTDTIYHADLVDPLIKSLQGLSILAAYAKQAKRNEKDISDGLSYPPVYVALENRDPRLVNDALEAAKAHGFVLKRISPSRVDKCLLKSGWSWDRDAKQDYDGIQLWKWRLAGA